MSDFYFEKKVLVCGGAGFVGTNMILELLKRGAKVRATLHEKPAQIEDSCVEWVTVDLRTPEGCRDAVGDSEVVINAAASTSGASAIQNTPLVHVTPNVLLNTLLLDACYQVGVQKFLFISSNTVYPDLDHAVTEDEMMSGEPYGKYFPVASMKRFGEVLSQIYSEKIEKKMPVVVVRPGNLYGPYDDFEWGSSHVLPALIRKCVERMDPYEVWGDGKDIKDFLYVDDFVEGALGALEKIEAFAPINIASGRESVLNDVLQVILKVDGYSEAKLDYKADKPTMIPKRLIDISMAKEILGFEPKISIEEGIARTIRWYRNRTQSR